MARLFDDASSQYLQVGAAVVTAVPFTMACWFYTDDAAIDQYLISIGDTGLDTHYFGLIAAGTAGDAVRVAAAAGGAASNASTSTGFSVNTWHHACGVCAAADDRRAFIDGGSKGTITASRTPAGLDSTAIGRLVRGAPTGYTSGRIAEAAIWDVALTDAEVAILGKGFSPLFVRPASLVGYWPLIGNYSPEIDRVGANNLTVTGAVKDNHSRIFVPSMVQVAAFAPLVLGPLYEGTLGDLGFEFGMGALSGEYSVFVPGLSRQQPRLQIGLGIGI